MIVQPPTVVLFCNEPQAISRPYQRYLLSSVREQMNFEEVPIKLYLRRRQASDSRDDVGADSDGATRVASEGADGEALRSE